MDSGAAFILVLFVIVIGIAMSFGRYAKASSILEDWARENGYALISSERRSLFRGPFFLTTSKSQLVYHIVVEDANGLRRSGYARVGGWMIGLLSDNVDVRWD